MLLSKLAYSTVIPGEIHLEQLGESVLPKTEASLMVFVAP